MEPLFQPLVNGGFVCLSISYRLATDVSNLGAAVEDIEQAIRYVQAHASEFKADPGKLALVGESAGGQLAAMAALGGSGRTAASVIGRSGRAVGAGW